MDRYVNRRVTVNEFVKSLTWHLGKPHKVSHVVMMTDGSTPPNESQGDVSAETSDLPPTNLCEYQITFRDCVTDHEEAQNLSNIINVIALSYSRYFPLQRLDGITLAYDYASALAELDRGFGATSPLSATNESYATGVAMSPMVLRDGLIKTRVVINAHIAYALLSEVKDERDFAAQVFAHEFAHVSLNQTVDECFPGVLLKPLPNQYEGWLYNFSSKCFDEYFATKHSSMLDSNLIEGYRDTLISVCEAALAILSDAQRQYLLDKDFIAYSDTVMGEIKKIMGFSGYLIGQADGVQQDVFDSEGKLDEALSNLFLKEWFDTLQDRLSILDKSYPNWSDLEEIFVLNRSTEEAARIHYLWPKPSENPSEGPAWVDVQHPMYWRRMPL